MIGFFHLSTGAKILLALCGVVLIAEGVYINYVMGGAVFNVVTQKTSCERVIAKWEEVNTRWAEERDVYTGPAAAVDYENTPIKQAANFKTAIDEAVAKGPNFAGKYAVAQWGCGSNCQGHAVVNVESGKIVSFGPATEAGVGINERSPIMITNPRENFPSVAEMQKADLETLSRLSKIPREYYVLIGDNDSNVGLQRICVENPFEGMRI